MALLQGQPPPYSEAQQIITSVVGVSEPNLMALAAAQNTRLPDAVPEEQPVILTTEHDPNLDCFKQKIYRHALFPLLAMVFEKCESATSFPDSTTNGFEKDLKACMKCLEGLDKPLMEDDEEINQLMLRAVQVLRIHLMEVEKVNELCKDFCARYISCLKSKLTSESLLHVEGCDSPPPLDCSPGESLSPGMATSPSIQVQTSPITATAAVTPAAMVGGGVLLQQTAAPQPQQTQQPQIVSGNTVYQMVRTPQGIVAQPIQIQGPLTPLSTTPQQSTAIHGSTPLSQVGLAALASPPAAATLQPQHAHQPPQQHQSQVLQKQQQQLQPQQPQQSQTPQPQSQISTSHQVTQQQQQQQSNAAAAAAALISQTGDRNLLNVPNTSEEADDEEKNGKQKRGVLPKHATQIMKSWLFQHIVHPYPTEDEKRQIASQTNLTLLQVNNWFINARRRILQPMLEVSNPDKGKAKKPSKPVQHRFWPVQSDSSSSTQGDANVHIKLEKGAQSDEVASHSASRTGQVAVASASLANGFSSGTVIDVNGGMANSAAIPSEALMNFVQNSGLVLKVGPDGHIIPAVSQVAAPPPPPPPPNPGAITLESLQALQSSGLLFAPGPSPLNLSLPFNGLAPPTAAAITGAGLAGFGLAGAFPGLAAAAAAASIMNFNPAAAAAAAAYAPLSFANLNATPIDLSSMSSQSAPIQLISSAAANTAQINAQLQMQMAGLSYQGMDHQQSVGADMPEEGGQLHIDMESSSRMGDVGD